MTVTYKGMDQGMDYRLAEIQFEDAEEPKVERIVNLMVIKGWERLNIVTNGYAQCEVEDRDEFRYFMKDWKESKRCIAQCMKFGF